MGGYGAGQCGIQAQVKIRNMELVARSRRNEDPSRQRGSDGLSHSY